MSHLWPRIRTEDAVLGTHGETPRPDKGTADGTVPRSKHGGQKYTLPESVKQLEIEMEGDEDTV